MYLLVLVFLLGLLLLACLLGRVWLRNVRAQRFFQQQVPELPVMPRPSRWSGHLFRLLVDNKCPLKIDQWHEKLGPTFGYYYCDQPWVATKDLELIKRVLLDESHLHRDRARFGMPLDGFNSSIFEAEGADWSRARQVLGAALAGRQVKGPAISDDIHESARELVALLRDWAADSPQGGVSVDAHDLMERFSLKVIFGVLYKSAHLVSLDGRRADPWTEQLRAAYLHIYGWPTLCSIMFPFARNLLTGLAAYLSPLAELEHKLIHFIGRATASRRSANYRRRLVDLVLEGHLAGKLSRKEYLCNVMFLNEAGFVTTSVAASHLLWLLARHPAEQARLRRAIELAGPEAPYLSWCIMESLRLHAPVPTGTGRLLARPVQVPNTSVTLPAGCYLLPSTRALQLDESNWPQPHRFRPDRWDAQARRRHPAALMAFGLGPRNCVGKKLAMEELKVLFCELLGSFEVLADGAATPTSFEFTCPGPLISVPERPIRLRLVPLSRG